MKKRILCFGDSNTWGAGGLTTDRFDENTRWTMLLAKKLGDGYTIIEEGQNGRTTVWNDPIENRMAGLDYLWPCMESHYPFDLIIFMLGTNDTKPYFGTNALTIARGLKRLVEMAKTSKFGIGGEAPKVLITAPIQIGENLKNDPEMYNFFQEQSIQISKGFAKAYQALAEETNCYFLDAAQFANVGNEDYIHLDAKGHAQLADAFYNKVIEILG